MHLTLLILVGLVVVDCALLSAGVRPARVLAGHGILALGTFALCTIFAGFSVGTHSVIPGWMAGIFFAVVVVLGGVLGVGTWKLMTFSIQSGSASAEKPGKAEQDVERTETNREG